MMKQINWDRLWLAGSNASAHADTHTHTQLHALSYCSKVFGVTKLFIIKKREIYTSWRFTQCSYDLWPSLEYERGKPFRRGVLREKTSE